ncbi:MAG: response regulator [Candidatus Limnocylindria bacterium]
MGGGSGRPQVYIVEDDPGMLRLLADLAGDAGWEVYAFTRLAPFRSALARARPTMVIVDDELPDGRGGDFVRALREIPSLDGVAVIVCTAAQPPRLAELRSWAPVMAKPIDLAALERMMANAAAHHN